MSANPAPTPALTHAPVLAFAGEGLAELTLDNDHATLGFGGDAANAATMCARMGAPARLLGKVGDDPLGSQLLAFWRARGVDTSAVAIDADAPTGLYVNEVGRPGSPSPAPFTYWRRDSAGSRWSPQDITDSSVLAKVSGLAVTGITLAVSESCAAATWQLIESARQRLIPIICILNYRARLAPDLDALAQLVSAADVVIASVEDLEQTFPGQSPLGLLDIAGGQGRELVVTNGADGASVSWAGGAIHQPVLPVSVRDTVGAGDALAGAYLWARFHAGHSPGEALAWGAAAALLSVQGDGCARSYPDAVATAAARASLPAAEPCLPGRVVAGG